MTMKRLTNFINLDHFKKPQEVIEEDHNGIKKYHTYNYGVEGLKDLIGHMLRSRRNRDKTIPRTWLQWKIKPHEYGDSFAIACNGCYHLRRCDYHAFLTEGDHGDAWKDPKVIGITDFCCYGCARRWVEGPGEKIRVKREQMKNKVKGL